MTAKHDFKVRQGDTFRQLQLKIVYGGEPMDLTGAVIEMKIKHSKGGSTAADFNPTISNAEEGLIELPYWKVELLPFNYVYDLQITFTNEHTLTFLEGKFIVTKDV